MLSMSLLQRLEARLPGRATLELCPTCSAAGPPPFEELAAQAESRGYRVQRESLGISFTDSLPMWRFWVVTLDRARAASPDSQAQDMATADGVASSSIAPCGTDPRTDRLRDSPSTLHVRS
jgi:putative Mg2+ transporter-C (MgtC) family protein